MKRDQTQINSAWRILHRELVEIRGVLPSCINCDHWNELNETCTKFKLRPPAQVIVFSCGDDWIDLVPF